MEIATGTNPSEFPREYQPCLKWRILFHASGLILAICGIGISTEVIWNGRDPRIHLIGLGMLLLGASSVLSIRLTKLVLFEESLEVSVFLMRRAVHRNDYKGRRTIRLQHFDAVILTPRQGTKNFSLPLLFELDDVFQKWLLPLPDFAQADRDREAAELIEKVDAGLPAAEALAKLKSVRTISQALNVVGGTVALWLFFYPYPNVPAVVAAALSPVFAIAFVAYHRGVVVLNGGQKSLYPQVGFACFLPMVPLGWRGACDVHVVDLTMELLVGASIGLLFMFLSWMVDATLKRQKAIELVIGTVLIATYGFGIAAYGNSLCDTNRPVAHQTRIIKVQEHKGSKYHYFEVVLAPWGPLTDSHSIHVEAALFRELRQSDEVTVKLYPGVLGIRWFTVHK